MNLDGKIHLYFYNSFQLQAQAPKTITISACDCVTKRDLRCFYNTLKLLVTGILITRYYFKIIGVARGIHRSYYLKQ